MTSTDVALLQEVLPPLAGARPGRRTAHPLSINLTIHTLDQLARDLLPFYGEDCPVAVVYDDRGPANEIVQGTLATVGRWADEITAGRPVRVLVG